MKKVFLLLIVIGLISPIMVVAQWTPATTSSNTPISRSGLVGIGFDAPTAPSAQLHLFSNSKDGEIDVLNVDTVERLPGRLFLLLNEGDKPQVEEIMNKYASMLPEEPKSVIDRAYDAAVDRISLDK